MESIKLIECPRDAMQGIKPFIETSIKVNYINKLLQVGFDTIDFGSFVSPKAIPQMRDTYTVLSKLNLSQTRSKLLAIVANVRGAEDAIKFEEISFLGYPFSISENFQMRNTSKTISQSIVILDSILNLASKNNKKVVAYLSMGFGNPYGDPWDVDIVANWIDKLAKMGVKILSLSDTVGSSNGKIISYLFSNLIPMYPQIEFGAHLHTTPTKWFEKVDAAYQSGCNRFDGAILGFGGCPMAKDELTGNMPTEKLINYFKTNLVDTQVDEGKFKAAFKSSQNLFSSL